MDELTLVRLLMVLLEGVTADESVPTTVFSAALNPL
jgi:hypothetical protein